MTLGSSLLRGESGGATLLAAALVGVVASVSLAVAAAAGVLIERHRLSGAVDAAALAAADAASGVVSGIPCEAADRLARANGARVESCRIEGSTAEVRVASTVGPFTVRAVARAGQPSSRRSVRTDASKK